jgi:protein-tyrosine phosphatase
VSERFSVAFVCTGNRFRSPLAAALFERAGADVPLQIQSLGTLDLGSVHVLPEAAAAASRLGVDLSEHRAQGIVPGSLASCDLVVGFERAHLAAAVIDGGARRERTFTLPELVELLGSVEPPAARDAIERARQSIVRADAARSGRNRLDLPEVKDPLGRSAGEQAEISDVVESLAATLARALFGDVAAARARAG